MAGACSGGGWDKDPVHDGERPHDPAKMRVADDRAASRILGFRCLAGGQSTSDEWQRSRRDWRRLCEGEGEEQIVPGREDQVDRYRCQLAEEVIAWPKLNPGIAPEFVADVADGMHGEGQQVEAYQDGREILLSVSEGVLKVVTLVLQDVERLVLDFPPGPATGGKLDDIVGTDRQISDEAVCTTPSISGPTAGDGGKPPAT